MDARAIDHVNLRIPADGVEPAVDFYGERLGFEIEGLDRYRADDKPFFDVRLTQANVIHLWPTPSFDSPEATNYDHVAILIEESIETIREELTAAEVPIEQELTAPLGATGEAPAVYVRDPFGYRVELKEAAGTAASAE